MLRLALALAALGLLAGCAAHGNGTPPPVDDPPTDAAFLSASLWDDGQAEVAFYRLERTRTPYGEGEPQDLLVGTYVVKHDYSAARQSKARPEDTDAVSAFKYALFYAFESGSYEYKRAWVTQARQADLRPLKSSFTMFDWCANSYRELLYSADGAVRHLYRSDDYGNAEDLFRPEGRTVPAALVPLLVRALTLDGDAPTAFAVLRPDGRVVGATAMRDGTATIETPDGPVEGERLVVRYDGDVPSVLGETADREETYVRGTDEARRLLAVEGASGAYRLTLVEALRSPYWSENFWPQLRHVRDRP